MPLFLTRPIVTCVEWLRMCIIVWFSEIVFSEKYMLEMIYIFNKSDVGNSTTSLPNLLQTARDS